MSTEEAARGAVGLPRGGPEESEGGPAAASAAAAEPLALADGWEDWPEEVWAEFRRGAEPLTWNRAQRIAGRVCREGSLRYGRERAPSASKSSSWSCRRPSDPVGGFGLNVKRFLRSAD